MTLPFTLPRRFSLKVLLAVIAAAAVLFAVGISKRHGFAKQQEAVARLTDLSGGDWLMVAKERSQGAWCAALEKLEGVEYHDVVGIEFFQTCTPEMAQELLAFPRLRHLSFFGGVTDDEVLVAISNLDELENLEILSGLGRVANLSIWRPAAPTDRGVVHLGRLKKLRRLFFQAGFQRAGDDWKRLVTDAGVAPLALLPELEYLDIGGTDVTIHGVRPLLAKNRLQTLIVPKSFSEHVDELLAVESLRLINIAGLSETLLVRAPQRLRNDYSSIRMRFDANQFYERLQSQKVKPLSYRS